MAKVTLDVSTEMLKELLVQLSPTELQALLSGLQAQLETWHMMRLAETAFAEWEREGDLYSDG